MLIQKLPGTVVSHPNAVRKCINKCRESGSVKDTGRSGRPSILTQDKLLDILNRVDKAESNTSFTQY